MDKIIKFQGNEYLLVGGSLEAGGAITTEEAYLAFAPSYAHLMRDGKVMRYGDSIGHRDEIEVVRELSAKQADFGAVVEAILAPNLGGWSRGGKNGGI